MGTLAGTGELRAKGGNTGNYSGAGGGGRIAVYYTDAAGFDLSGGISALGGDSPHNVAYDSAAGTIHLKDKADVQGAITAAVLPRPRTGPWR